MLSKNNVQWFTTENETKAQIVERFNRTFKNKMWKYFTENKTRKWVDVINLLVENYNNSYQRSIKMTPVEASLAINNKKVYSNLFGVRLTSKEKAKFKVGDRVRITVYRAAFRKGYLPNFTNEIFQIDEILYTDPITYKIMDLGGEEIKGTFYKEELVKLN